MDTQYLDAIEKQIQEFYEQKVPQEVKDQLISILLQMKKQADDSVAENMIVKEKCRKFLIIARQIPVENQ